MSAAPRLQVELPDRTVTVRFRLRGEHWHCDFHIGGIRHREPLKTSALPEAKRRAIQKVHTAVQRSADPGALAWRPLYARYMAEAFPDDSVEAAYALTRRGAKSSIAKFVAYIEAHETDCPVPSAIDHVRAKGVVQRWVNHRYAVGVAVTNGPLTPEGELLPSRPSPQQERATAPDTTAAVKRRDISGTTIDNGRRDVQAFFEWAMTAQLVRWEHNPALKKALKLPTIEARKREPVSTQRLDLLLAAAKETWMYPAVVMVISNGFRPIGTTRLRWRDVDLFARQTKLFEKKRDRVLSLTGWLIDELVAIKAKLKPAEEDFIVPFARNWLTKCFTRLCKKVLGAETPIRLANLRNTFMKLHYEAGTAPQFVARQAGNSIRTIERHYLDMSGLGGKTTEIDLRPKPAAAVEEQPKAKEA